MKKILLSLLAVGAIFTANAQMKEGVQARVYAYDLKINSEKVVTFKTNTVATTAKVIIDGITEEVVATSNDGKNWTATIEPTTEFSADVEYNWSVEVSAPAVQDFEQLSDPTSSIFSIYRSYALAVDNSPESDYFGRVYVVNQSEGTACSNTYPQYTYKGIYTYTPTLEAENAGSNYHAVGFIGDVSKRGDSANDMVVTADGRIFISNMTTNNAGIYYVNPKTFEYTKTNVSAPIAGIGSFGYGEDTQLYAIDMTNSTSGVVNRYDIGINNTLSESPTIFDTFKVGTTTATIQGKTYSSTYATGNSIDPVSTGFWICQYMTDSRGSRSALFYCNNEGVGKWMHEAQGMDIDGDGNADEFIVANNRQGALAVNEELGLVAFVANVVSSVANVRIFSYEVNQNGTLSTTYIGDFPMTMQGGRSNCLSFDYAGNLYSANEGAELVNIYTVPTNNNTRVTPAKKSSTISFTQDEIDIATGLDNIAVDANAPVEYYNMQGVKVENPSNGIFIKKQGNKTTKVVL